MTPLEQRIYLSYDSLKLMERMLFSEISRLRKATKKSRLHLESHYKLLRDYERAYSEIMGAIELYQGKR
ncbi:hypothetical protein FJZ20_02290 [Candidatus Pacearchaeota archaeon]|nr:hypothetical protein [Candidatus Pacearchaeota archaeon]